MYQHCHIYLIYSCYLTYSALGNASGTVPTHFTQVIENCTYFTQFTYSTYTYLVASILCRLLSLLMLLTLLMLLIFMYQHCHIYLIYSCYLAYYAIANADGTLPPLFTYAS